MKLHQLFESELPMAIDMVQRLLMKNEPVLFAFCHNDRITFRQIYDAAEEGVYTVGAGPLFAGKKFISVKTYGEGYYSWQNRGMGIGNNSTTAPITCDVDDYDIIKHKVFKNRPPIFVFGFTSTIDKVKERTTQLTETSNFTVGNTASDDGRETYYIGAGYYITAADQYDVDDDTDYWYVYRIMDDTRIGTLILTARGFNEAILRIDFGEHAGFRSSIKTRRFPSMTEILPWLRGKLKVELSK